MTIVKKRQGIIVTVLLFFAFLTAASCYADEAKTQDPFQRFNRAMFVFNDKIDVLVLKPIATLYNKIIPKPLNAGVRNFFNNINEVPTIVNDILQLKFYQTANDSWRFIINSTVGIGGLFDVGTRAGLPHYLNDFGLTMANYGWVNSAYLVLPFLGPATIRDGIEIPVDYYAFSLYPYIDPPSARWIVYGVGVIDRRVQLLKVQNILDEAALDKYVFVRNAYLQRRAFEIEENRHRSALEAFKARHAVVDEPIQEEMKPTPEALTPRQYGNPVSVMRPSASFTNF